MDDKAAEPPADWLAGVCNSPERRPGQFLKQFHVGCKGFPKPRLLQRYRTDRRALPLLIRILMVLIMMLGSKGIPNPLCSSSTLH